MGVSDQALSQVGEMTGISGSFNLSGILIGILIFLVVGSLIGWAVFAATQRKRLSQTVIVFEDMGNGAFQDTAKYKGMKVKIGQMEEALFIPKLKKYLPSPVLKTKKGTYWYFIGEDGEWINFLPANYNKDRRELGAHIIHADMRYQKEGLAKQIKGRAKNQSWWAENWTQIVTIGVITMLLVFVFLGIQENRKLNEGMLKHDEVKLAKDLEVANAQKEILSYAGKILGYVEAKEDGGSGIIHIEE